MSALLQLVPRRVGGLIEETFGTLAPDHFHNGLPYTAGGTLAVEGTGVIDHWHQGLPFTAAGRLRVRVADPTYFGSGAAPFAVDGGLSVATASAADHWSSGVAYNTASRVALT